MQAHPASAMSTHFGDTCACSCGPTCAQDAAWGTRRLFDTAHSRIEGKRAFSASACVAAYGWPPCGVLRARLAGAYSVAAAPPIAAPHAHAQTRRSIINAASRQKVLQ